MVSRGQHEHAGEVLLEIAQDLTASLAAGDRYQRLLAAVRRLVPCDAACLLRVDGDDLVPIAAHGLVEGALARRFRRSDHPRLDRILASDGPVRFPPDSPLPDPFDGLVEGDAAAIHSIHACLGCALREGGEVVGALTADAIEPHAFDRVDPWTLATLGALAGAALRTTALIEALERLAERRGAVARDLQRTAGSGEGGLIGAGPAARKLLGDVAVVAPSDLPVLIAGETGAGKEIVARLIHERSRRRDEALIQVNCAALPESLAESELFGHVAGSFTGATRNRAGKFEIADGGTLLLDEIGELPLAIQPKLLRALQQGEIQRVGEDSVRRVDVRVLAATNRDLEKEIDRGRFRADLYHRLAVYPIRVPPLRDRAEDVPLFAEHFLELSRRRLGLRALRLDDDARRALARADWPGNVRELENVISRAVLRAAAAAPGGATIVVGLEHLDVRPARDEVLPEGPSPGPRAGARPEPAARPLRDRVRDFQRRAIEEAVERRGGNWAAAARDLGLHRGNLHRLARSLGLRGG